ncbi:hypothetical protein V7079_27030 [Priestia megaterium]|uniref:hypothetical protein n=1 Tax=Priestia megaterium TaxID=1404 RepID=UPI000BF3DC1A|nr:hypothetical protein [Priestia megaterium]PFK01989.1 hypothetical protein COI96_06245 [Priestia megaterium]PMD08144.1 hypothetical protein CJ194_19285 [Priestia megaterium]
MGKINRPKSANILVLEPTEERRKEILNIIGIMMMDYINYREDNTENNRNDNENYRKIKKKDN